MKDYLIALATGLTIEQAKLVSTAMTHSDAVDISHLTVIKK